MRMLQAAGLVAGLLIAMPLALSQAAAAKCMPATERLLPRPAGKQFITVLVTCNSRIEALKIFADLSAKQPHLLGSSAVNVDEVSLGAKGTYYRALIGEPGPKDAAAATCTALRATGYKWCRAMQH